MIGACLGAVGVALVWQLYPGFWKEQPLDVEAVALQHRQELQARTQADAAAALAASTPPAAHRSACALEPMVPSGGASDGKASLEHPFPAGPAARAKVLARAADAAGAEGRPRDAERALLAACREHEKASAKPSVPLARVLAMLGESYVAAASRSEDLREPLLERARQVFAASADSYAKALGPLASRTRLARERLARLEREGADVSEVRLAQDDGAGTEGKRITPRPSVITSPVRPAAQAAAMGTKPPRDVPAAEPAAKRSAVAESDPELRQLASDLARLRSQAEAVSADPAALARRAEAARALRDQCRDAACVRAWYAQRRRELLAEF